MTRIATILLVLPLLLLGACGDDYGNGDGAGGGGDSKADLLQKAISLLKGAKDEASAKTANLELGKITDKLASMKGGVADLASGGAAKIATLGPQLLEQAKRIAGDANLQGILGGAISKLKGFFNL